MLKLLNILVVAYLAVAPGMNVEVLIHSVNLCDYTAPQVATEQPAQASHCGHDHGCPTQEDTPEETEGCPHIHQAVSPTTAMPAMQVQSFDDQPCPAVCEVSSLTPISVLAQVPVIDHSRPPPGPDLVATTILLL